MWLQVTISVDFSKLFWFHCVVAAGNGKEIRLPLNSFCEHRGAHPPPTASDFLCTPLERVSIVCHSEGYCDMKYFVGERYMSQDCGRLWKGGIAEWIIPTLRIPTKSISRPCE